MNLLIGFIVICMMFVSAALTIIIILIAAPIDKYHYKDGILDSSTNTVTYSLLSTRIQPEETNEHTTTTYARNKKNESLIKFRKAEMFEKMTATNKYPSINIDNSDIFVEHSYLASKSTSESVISNQKNTFTLKTTKNLKAIAINELYTLGSNVTIQKVTTQSAKRYPFAVTLHSYIEKQLLNAKDPMNEVYSMSMINELPLNSQIIGISMRNGLLHVGTNDGLIRLLDPRKSVQVCLFSSFTYYQFLHFFLTPNFTPHLLCYYVTCDAYDSCSFKRLFFHSANNAVGISLSPRT